MHILLDENIPRKLKYRLTFNHEVFTVQEKGWSGVQNGDLLSRAELEFDVFLTLDRNLEYQQELKGKRLSVLVLKARSSTYRCLLPLVPDILKALEKVDPGTIIHVSG